MQFVPYECVRFMGLFAYGYFVICLPILFIIINILAAFQVYNRGGILFITIAVFITIHLTPFTMKIMRNI